MADPSADAPGVTTRLVHASEGDDCRRSKPVAAMATARTKEENVGRRIWSVYGEVPTALELAAQSIAFAMIILCISVLSSCCCCRR